MFDDKTFEKLQQDALAMFPDDLDKREGSVAFDAIAAFAFQHAQFYQNLGGYLAQIFLATAEGGYLDAHGAAFGVERKPAEPAQYHAIYTGELAEGDRFFYENLTFWAKLSNDNFILVGEQTGALGNDIPLFADATPIFALPTLDSCQFGALVSPGAGIESDDHYRARIQERLAQQPSSGNAAHYKQWCESVPGVWAASIFPLWPQENCVTAVLVDADGNLVSDDTVAACQRTVDPIRNGYQVGNPDNPGHFITLGDGIGEGLAPIGAHFWAASPNISPQSITVEVALHSNWTPETAQPVIEKAILDYFKRVIRETPSGYQLIIRTSGIGAAIAATDCTKEYRNLVLWHNPTNTAGADAAADHIVLPIGTIPGLQYGSPGVTIYDAI